ncbi:MAG: AAA family ATPase, partial [Gemmatimonadota bacterium]
MYRLQCFGTLLVETLDGREIHFRSRKHLALLLYLATHPKRAIGRGSLAALFWDTDEDAARHSLSQALYDLRKRLHPFQLHTRGGGLRLAEGQVRYEGAEFEEAIRSGDLTVATALYRGAFAPNLERVGAMDFERWYEAERDRFRTLAQMCLRKYVEQCDLQGQWGEMCLTALRLVKLDPLDEGAHRSLMRALWLHGDQQSALKHYAEVRSFLVKELPTGPSAETLELVERIKSSRPRASRPLQPGDQRLPLVGRASEFEKLRTEVRQIRSKRGRILVLRGEAGIGKTRLLEEMAKIAPVEGIAHFRSRCYPAEANVAYGPILDGIQPIATRLVKSSILASHDYYQLGHLFPQLFVRPPEEEFEAIDPAVRQRRLYEEVTDLIRRMCAATPVLWVVEDVQWIDRSSASLLHYIARRLRERPFTLILSVRSEIALGEAAARLMGEAGAQVETHFLDLGPLDEASVRELIVLAAGDADEDARQLAEKYSGGNPFYALEILRAAQAGDGGGPRSQGLTRASLLISNRLRVLLTARLQGLPPQALRLLEAVAALDRHAAPQHVTKVAGLLRHEAEPLSMELCARGLLREAEDRFEFTHDIMREFVYKNLGLLRRAALHLAVGEILASASDAGPAILAHHFQLGADQARAYEFAIRGAEEAVSTCAHREAVSMATVAQSVAATPEHRFAALRLRAEAELAAGDFKAG